MKVSYLYVNWAHCVSMCYNTLLSLSNEEWRVQYYVGRSLDIVLSGFASVVFDMLAVIAVWSLW